MAPTDVRNYIPLPVRVPGIRQSSIGDLETCERYFMFRHRFGLVPGRHASAPYMGKVLHLCLNGYWQGLTTDDINARVRIAVADHRNRVLEWAQKGSSVDSAEKELRKFDRDTAIACSMAAIMWERFPKAAFEAQLKCKLEIVELEEDYSYESEYGPVGGRLDVVLRVVECDNPDLVGNLVILDFKTASDPGAYLLTAGFAVQPLLYASLLRRRFPDSRVLGFIHIAMAKPKYDAYADSLERMRDWVDGRDDTVGTGECFKSGPRKGQPKPRWEHGDEAASRIIDPVIVGVFTRLVGDPEARLARRFKRFYAAANIDPMLENFDTTGNAAGHCTSLYGKPCPYLRFCGNHHYQWGRIAQDHYHVAETESSTEDLTEIT